MRHRAQRPLLGRLRKIPRELLIGGALVLVGAVTGVGVAVQQGPDTTSAGHVVDGAATPDAAVPPAWPHTQEPSSSLAPRASDRATQRPSRDAARSPEAGPSETASPTSDLPEPSSDLPSPSVTTPTSGSPSDTEAPSTTASTLATSAETWTISVEADESATYQCSLDGDAYQSCSGTVTYNDLKNGQHTFAVRATDAAGNTDPSPAQLTVQISRGKGNG